MAVHHWNSTGATNRGRNAQGLIALMSERAHRPLLQHAPNGPAWPRDPASWFYKVTKATAYSFARIYRRVEDLIREYSPRKAVELLPDWETDWGVVAAGTNAQRQAAVVAKINGLGTDPLSTPSMLLLLTVLGLQNISTRTYAPLFSGDRVRSLILGVDWRFRTDFIALRPASSDTLTAVIQALRLRQHGYGIFGWLDPYGYWQRFTTTQFVANQLGAFELRNPVASGCDGIMTVGATNTAYVTLDGTDYKPVTMGVGFAGSLRCGVQSTLDGTIVVGGSSGEVQYHLPAAATFVRVSVAGEHRGMAHSPTLGLFVTVGDSGLIKTSPDGITWTTRTPGSSYAGNFQAVTWTGAYFVAVGSAGEVQISTNGTTWTRIATGSALYTKVAHVNIAGLTPYTYICANTLTYARLGGPGPSLTTGLSFPGLAQVYDIRPSPDGKYIIAFGANSGGDNAIARSEDNAVTARVSVINPATEGVWSGIWGCTARAPFIVALNGTVSRYRATYAGPENAIENSIP